MYSCSVIDPALIQTWQATTGAVLFCCRMTVSPLASCTIRRVGSLTSRCTTTALAGLGWYW